MSTSPYRRFLRFLRTRCAVEWVLLLLWTGAFVQYGGSKGFAPQGLSAASGELTGAAPHRLLPREAPPELRFSSIGVSSNAIWLSLSWPTGTLAEGDWLDVFAAPDLSGPDDLLPAGDAGSPGWRWCAGHAVVDGATNVTLSVPPPSGAGLPPAQFFRAVVSPLPPVPDADGDGLADGVDPAPQVAGPDAHGSNAEWYGAVCPDVFTTAAGGTAGGAVALPNGETVHFRDDVNANAYYFVEVVAARGPAAVFFGTETPGRLGEPVVIARAGETNRVPLLIGAEYAVTSSVPISVAAPDADCAEIVTNDCRSYAVKWPVRFLFARDESVAAGRAYRVEVDPPNLGGTFEWSAVGEPAPSPPRRSAPRSAPRHLLLGAGGGCGVSGFDGGFAFNCSGGCGCGGCTATGYYVYEDIWLPVAGGSCGCSPDDDEDGDADHEDTDPDMPDMPHLLPHVEVHFSHSAVIFEDEYQNEVDGPLMPRRSTKTYLHVYADAGTENAVLHISAANLDRLRTVDGQAANLPETLELGAYCSYLADFEYEGDEASECADDVTVAARIENDRGDCEERSDALTVVEVELEPRRTAPTNRSDRRHRFGVYELVDCRHKPGLPGIVWTLAGGGTTNNAPEGFVENQAGRGVLRCPLTDSGTVSLRVTCGDTVYCPAVEFVEPSDVVAEKVDYRFDGQRPMGAAGGVSLVTSLYVHPKDVNFEEIALEEIPWEQGGSVSGYYAQPANLAARFHDKNHGAGTWRAVTAGNFWSRDVAGSKAITNWCEGVKVWDAPIGWSVKGATGDDDFAKMIGSSSRFRQIFSIGADGTFRLDKFGHWVSRGVSTNPEGPDNGQYFLDGDLRNLEEDIERWREEDRQGESVEILP